MFGARFVCLLAIAALLVSATPVNAQSAPASAPRLGMDAGSAQALRDAGAQPVYASFWVGQWMASSGWGGLDAALQKAKAIGATPVVYWYYWGDSITPSCVDNGCSGKSRGQWDSLTNTLVDHLRSQMQGAPVVVVLENEFNKGGITATSYAPTFDAMLEAKALQLKGVSGVTLVLGFGGWSESEWSRFPKAIAASDAIGFQLMRASTKDSESSYRGAADRIGQLVAASHAVAPTKGSFLYDLALSSYPDSTYVRIQDETLAALLAKWGAMSQQGLQGIVYRELTDNPSMGLNNYFGIAEQYWGFRSTNGAYKPAWTTWKSAATSASPPPPPAPTPAPTPTPMPTPAPTPIPPSPPVAFTASFQPHDGNGWWVQTRVLDATGSVASVCASVDGGACQPLKLQSWGSWAASFRVPLGAQVVFTATSGTGQTVRSGAYTWGTALTPPPQPPTPPPAPSATFTPYAGNAWWVQARVAASSAISAVCASINGGACQALKLQGWGAWAASFYAPAGSKVVFKATTANGVATSQAYVWPVK